MQVGLDYQTNLNSLRVQNVFGSAFTVPKLEDLGKNVPPRKTEEKQSVKSDEFAKAPSVEDSKDKIDTPKTLEKEENQVKKPKTLREKISGAWKFMASADQMVGATLKGVLYGALTGIALLGGSWLFKSLPNAFTKEGPGLWKTITHPLKNISKSGKVIAGIGSAIVLAYNVIKGKLDTNQRTAVIDHKMKTGHRA